MRKIKVLIVHPQFWINGGAEKVIIRLCNYLSDHYIENTILTTKMIPEIKAQLLDTRVIEAQDLNQMGSVYHLICDDFNVINIHNEPCHLMSFAKKKNTIWLCNEPPNNYANGGIIPEEEKRVVRSFIKKVIVADEFNKQRFKEIYNMDSTIIPYGIDYEFFNNGEKGKFKEEFNVKGMIFSQVAFIAPTKNQLRTVEIFSEIKKKYPIAKLVLAGFELPDYKREVEKRIWELGLTNDVIFTGLLSPSQVRNLYYDSSYVLMPTKSQGSWLSVFEAMSVGVPVLVSKDMTASSILKENDIGFVCETNEDFINKIDTLTPSEVTLNINRSLEFIKEKLTWDNFCKKMLEEFEKCQK
jgi:glycosyltransferase involved in cell wall biosynthesis